MVKLLILSGYLSSLISFKDNKSKILIQLI